MKKRILAVAMILSLALSSSAFAHKFVEYAGDWYVVNENTNEFLKGVLLDVGDSVYYLDENGKLVTGWWLNEKSNKYYFFDNDENKNLGGMLFGLHMIDGYYRYFGNDGALATSDREGDYKKVYKEYYADYTGKLYFNNELQRDTSINKSEYYSDPLYYKNVNLNNYYLANYGKVQEVGIAHSANNAASGQGNALDETKRKEGIAYGGTDYYIDDMGRVIMPEDTFKISDGEKYGPMNRVD